MKCYFVIVLLFAAGCGDAVKNSLPEEAVKLTGTWELSEAQHGMMPAKQYPSGNSNRFSFKEASYEQNAEGNPVKKGTYEVLPDTSASASVGLVLPAGEFGHRIIFDGDTTSNKMFLHVKGDTLWFLSGYFPVDGGSKQTYLKRK